MRNKYTLVLLAITIAFTGIFATQTADAAKRKIVLEDHNGAWCGWCPLGTEIMEKLRSQYGTDFIPVGVHSSDGMEVQPYRNQVASKFNVVSAPSGSINRLNINGKIINDRGVWKDATDQLINQNVPVGVSVNVDYDKYSGDFTATITAVVETQVNGQLAFNLWVLEDYMKGTGPQWDQSNYVSGVAQYSSSEYYNQPKIIVGYEHMNVFRGATGGVDGDKDGFPTGNVTPAGTYKKVIKGNVLNLNVDDTYNAYFVGMVQNTSTNEIINAEETGRPNYTQDVPVAALTVGQSDFYKFVNKQTTKTSTIQIKNNIDSKTNYRVVLSSNSVVPNGWDISFIPDVDINANGTYNLEVTVDPKGNKGMANLLFRIISRVADVKNQKAETNILFLAEGTERAIIQGNDPNPGTTAQVLDLMPNIKDTYARIPMDISQFASLQSDYATMFKTVIIPVYENWVTFSTANFSSNLNAIKSMMANGTDLLIAAPADMAVAGGYSPSKFPPTPDVINFFENTLGVKYSGLSANLVNTQTGQLYTFPISGVTGDEISNGISFAINNKRLRTIQTIYTMQLTPNSKAVPFLEIPNPTDPVTNLNNKMAVRVDNNGQRTIFMSMPLDGISADVIVDLTNKMVTWLEAGKTQAAGPKIALSTTQLVFGEIEVGKKGTETEMITNNGDEKLVITAINLKNGTNFTVKSGTLPLTIDAGQTVNLNIEFTPTDKLNYQDEITFVSNDKANPNKVMTVRGIGITAPTSVPGVISDVFEMKVTPNPVVDNSVLEFNNLKGSNNVNITLIDATGKVVSNLYNGITTGSTVGLNANQLSSGTYFIKATVNGKTTQLPIVVAK